MGRSCRGLRCMGTFERGNMQRAEGCGRAFRMSRWYGRVCAGCPAAVEMETRCFFFCCCGALRLRRRGRHLRDRRQQRLHLDGGGEKVLGPVEKYLSGRCGNLERYALVPVGRGRRGLSAAGTSRCRVSFGMQDGLLSRVGLSLQARHWRYGYNFLWRQGAASQR